MILGNLTYAQDGSKSLIFSTYIGNETDPGGSYFSEFATPPSAADKLTYRLKQFDLSNGSTSALDQVTSYSGSDEPQNGDLIQLGFFDTDPANDGTASTISPGTDVNSAFKGEWTPLTDKLRIGYDHTSSDIWGAGHYGFRLKFQFSGGVSTGELQINADNNDASARTTLSDSLGESIDPDNNLADRYNALDANSLIGIRYYDQTDPSAQTTRYNTIMHSSWKFVDDAKITLFDPSTGSLRSNLLHEFDNTNARSLGYTKIGSGNNAPDDDFAATITYFDGASTLDMSSIGSTILSGLKSNGTSSIEVDTGNVLTIHSTSGNNYDYNGTIRENGGAGASSIVKTGDGEQILTGAINLAGSNTGFINIWEGNLTLAPTSASSQLVEYITGGSSSAVLELNNTGLHSIGAGSDPLIQLGFANSSAADFNGSVVLSGTGTEVNIKVSANSASSDYNNSQTFSGVVSGTEKLVKTGVGRLVLDNTNTFDGGVEIEDGTLVASKAGALGDDNDVTITKGKFEVSSGVTLSNANTPTITAGNSNKTMIGGSGDLNNGITIGSGTGEIDTISPGTGISSSLTSDSSQQQVSLGDRTGAIGTFTVGGLTLADGGVYDWEISDFSGNAGTDWDLLLYDSLSYNTSDTFNINIFGLEANGSAGPLAGGSVWQNYTSNGFRFMDVASGGTAWSGSSGYLSNMDVDSRGWSYYNDHWLADWNVWHDGSGAFYLQYSAVPEPSTYIMVTGLMLVPGMNAVRKYRNRKKKQGLEEPEEEIIS